MNTFLFNITTFAQLDLGIFCYSCLLLLLTSIWMFRWGSVDSRAESGLRADSELSVRHSCIVLAVCSELFRYFLLFFMNSWWSFTYLSLREASVWSLCHTAQAGGALEPCSDD